MPRYTHNKSRSRSLTDLILRVGDVPAQIDSRLLLQSQVRILEVGCGHGAALIELGRKYGERVSLHGVNKSPEPGLDGLMRRLALRRGLCTEDDVTQVRLPEIHYFDVCGDWPLPDASFDIVFSQHAFLWFQDKVKVLEEINRVLTDDGVALLDLQIKRRGPVRKNSIVILAADRRVSFFDYVREYNNLIVHEEDRSFVGRFKRGVFGGGGNKTTHFGRRSFLEMKKSKNFSLHLDFCYSKPFRLDQPGRKGFQSVYRPSPTRRGEPASPLADKILPAAEDLEHTPA